MRNVMPFEFEVPINFFEKASAPKGQQRRIGGIISTENPDRQGEVVLAKGLDMDDWVKNGWFNDNHSKDTDGVVGYPEVTQFFQKGEILPDGVPAKAKGFWAEGYMLEGVDRADRIWKLGKALQGTGRSLGFSVEGNIHRRIGPKTVFKKAEKGGGRGSWVGNTVANATVRNVAITNCPVNVETGLQMLAKSLQAVEATEDPNNFEQRLDHIEKGLAMGSATGINPPPGPQTGEGAGQVLTGQSLERKGDPRLNEKKKKKKKNEKEEEYVKKALSYRECLEWFQDQVPDATYGQAARFVGLTGALKSQGRL